MTRSAARPAVLVLSRWTGYCLPCAASDRPLVLVWSGPADLRTRLLGPPPGTGTLRLTCGLCGGTDVVGWDDEHVDEALLREEPEPSPAAGLPVPSAVPSGVAARGAGAAEPVAVDGSVDLAPDLEAVDVLAADVGAGPGQVMASEQEPSLGHVGEPSAEPAAEPAVWTAPPEPGLDLLVELIDGEPSAPAWEPPLPVVDEALALPEQGCVADAAVAVPAVEPVAVVPVPVPVAVPVPDDPSAPAWVPTLSADVAAALRDLAGPAGLPAPRAGEDALGLVDHG